MTLDDFKDGDYDDQSEPEEHTYKGVAPIQVELNGGVGFPEFLDTPAGQIEAGYIRGTIPFKTEIEAMADEDAKAELEEFAEKKKDELQEEYESAGTNANVYVEDELLHVDPK